VAKHIAKRGEGIHHLCFDVADVSAAAADLEAKGFRPVGAGPKPGAGGRTVMFLNPKDAHGVLIELSAPS
jgi:methylmalonyl-CoA/ethylmalonyl-CoA epimerase